MGIRGVGSMVILRLMMIRWFDLAVYWLVKAISRKLRIQVGQRMSIGS
jgi:hypothetical protein